MLFLSLEFRQVWTTRWCEGCQVLIKKSDEDPYENFFSLRFEFSKCTNFIRYVTLWTFSCYQAVQRLFTRCSSLATGATCSAWVGNAKEYYLCAGSTPYITLFSAESLFTKVTMMDWLICGLSWMIKIAVAADCSA